MGGNAKEKENRAKISKKKIKAEEKGKDIEDCKELKTDSIVPSKEQPKVCEFEQKEIIEENRNKKCTKAENKMKPKSKPMEEQNISNTNDEASSDSILLKKDTKEVTIEQDSKSKIRENLKQPNEEIKYSAQQTSETHKMGKEVIKSQLSNND